MLLGGILILGSLTHFTELVKAQAPDDPNEVEGALITNDTVRVIVELQAPAAGAVVSVQATEVRETQQRVLAEVPAEEFSLIESYEVIPGLVGEVTAQGLQTLLAQPEVAGVALDLPVEAMLTESSQLIGADVVWQELGFTGAGINVAVLDTGIDPSHPDLLDNLVAQKCFNRGACPPNNTDQSDSADDENGHGTHIAGIISSRGERSPRGIAPEAGLVVVRVLGRNGTGFTSDVLAGLDWVITNHNQLNLKVINLSLGGGSYSGACDEADATTRLYLHSIELARAAGITVFAASGNSGWADQMMAPACISGVISVGSTYDTNLGVFSAGSTCTEDNARLDQVSCFSNSSSALDLLAPGAAILSTTLGNGQLSRSGTSMATAHGSGVAALMLQANPNLSSTELEMILKETGVPVTDGRNGRVTPRLNALAAVSQVTGQQIEMIAGTVLLQGRSDHSGTRIFLSPATCPASTGTTPAAVTAADGSFEIITNGQTYACLQAIQPGYLTGQSDLPGEQLGSVTLLGGDVNGDDLIDIFDLAYIGARFDSADPGADINRDNLVDIFDLVIAAGNYDKAGPVRQWHSN